MEEFGIFAKQLKVKVTNDVKKYDKLWVIPCAMGFKQDKKVDGKDVYVNEWVDVLVYPEQWGDAECIQKKDMITVFGRLVLSEWQDKKKWAIKASEIRSDKKPIDREQVPITEVPF